MRKVGRALPQAVYVACDGDATRAAVNGACAFTTEGLGLTPAADFGIAHAAEHAGEASALGAWFDGHWARLPGGPAARDALLERLDQVADHKAPSLVYHAILRHVLGGVGDTLDEERVVRSATGIRDTAVWKKLYRFQRDAVVGAIDKLERLGGCIIADSVGLGKTFEALAVIKYYELRNDRVLVLCPKRLRDNWTLPKANDRRNTLAADRFHYDVLNHTDLSRDDGVSGDVDLANLIGWPT
ncbi:MAG TPA: SNF2-related protein [Gemmatirosa sp.]